MRLPIYAIGAVLALRASAVLASCGSESCPLDHASRWSEAKLTYEVSYQYIDQDQPRAGTEDTSVGSIPREEDEVRTVNRVTTARASYRPAEGWSFGASLPLVDRYHAHIRHEGTESIEERWNYSGLGDLEVAALHSFSGGESAHRFFASAGVKAPTGDTNVADESGEQPEPSARPGTGSWDFLAGLGAEWRLTGPGSGEAERTIPVRLSLTGRWNGRGTEDYRVGSQVQVHAATEYPLARKVALLAQANFRVKAKDDVGSSGEDEEDTGGTVLYLSPGARLALSPGASLYGLVQVPVYQRVNGIQLVSDSNIYLGITGGL